MPVIRLSASRPSVEREMPGPTWLGRARCSPTPVADRPGCGHHPRPHERRRRTNAAADRGDECAIVQASNTLRRFGAVNRRPQLPFIRADTRFAVAQDGQAVRLKVWRCRSGYALAGCRRSAVSKAQRHPLRAPGRKRAMPRKSTKLSSGGDEIRDMDRDSPFSLSPNRGRRSNCVCWSCTSRFSATYPRHFRQPAMAGYDPGNQKLPGGS